MARSERVSGRISFITNKDRIETSRDGVLEEWGRGFYFVGIAGPDDGLVS